MRGYHAHKELKQILIAIAGSITVEIEHKFKKYSFELNDPGTGLYTPPMSWRVIKYHSEKSICFSAASEKYDPDDYIRDYNIFKKACH